MKIWLVSTTNTGPEQNIYLVGAHSTPESAHKQRLEMINSGRKATHIIELEVDTKQPPVLMGTAHDSSAECIRDTQRD